MPDRLPLALRAYQFASRAAAPLAPRLLARRLDRGKEHPTRLPERRGERGLPRPPGPLIWVHGASVGEMLAVVPLIERIRAQDFAVLVTSGTVTSAALAERRLPPGILHQFIPLDAPQFVSRFLDHWRPDLALFVESDLWPNLILASSARKIPVILVNGRVSERSFRPLAAGAGAIAALLGRFDLCLAQSRRQCPALSRGSAPRASARPAISSSTFRRRPPTSSDAEPFPGADRLARRSSPPPPPIRAKKPRSSPPTGGCAPNSHAC